MARLPVIAQVTTNNGSGLPVSGGSAVTDSLARGIANDALAVALDAQGAAGTAHWGQIVGDLDRQKDLQIQFAISEHALCGGI